MKSIKSRLTALVIAILCMGSMQAQEEKKWQMYEIHEDQVKPSMVEQYEKTAKMMADKMREHNIQEGGYLATSTSNMRYMYVNPIDSLGQVKGEMRELWEKMGQESFSEMMSGFDGTYDRHGDYVIIMDYELCYMPDGITQTPEGENYRKFYYVYFKPEHSSEMRDAMKGIKELFASKNSKVHYRVYRSGYGTMDEFYMVAVAAKNGVEMEQRSMENQKLLGEDSKPAWDKMMKLATRMEEYSGYIRTDLSFNPNKPTKK